VGPTQRFSSTMARAIGWAGTAVSGATLVGIGLDSVHDLAVYGGFVALVGVLCLALLVRPYVEVDDGGVVVRNPVQTVRVPWPAVQEVDGRYGLRLRTAYGKVTAWAAPAPVGRARARGEDSIASQAVSERLEILRTAGHLADPRLESGHADRELDVPVVVAFAVVTLWIAIALLTR
jgi:Bacterial PH domain